MKPFCNGVSRLRARLCGHRAGIPATHTIPNTGITLPFISYGGTSVLFLLSEMGLALSVSRWQKGNSGIY